MPIEGVDFESLVFVEEVHLLAVVEVGADEGVATLNIGREVGQGAFVEESELVVERMGGFAFEDFE